MTKFLDMLFAILLACVVMCSFLLLIPAIMLLGNFIFKGDMFNSVLVATTILLLININKGAQGGK